MWSFFDFLNDDKCALTILDIGAALGEEAEYQCLMDLKRGRLIGFEPDPEACRQLNLRYGAPHRFFPVFLGDGKPGIYYQTNWGQTGSLFKPNTPLLEKFQHLAEVVTLVAEHPVVSTRLDDIAEIDDVDFIKIDVQGSELAVLSNASRALSNAVLIQTEVSFVESYVGQPMFSDIDAFLRQSGFQFHDFVGVGSRPFKPLSNPANPSPHRFQRAFRQLIWADVYYVKDWMRLDTVAPGKLEKMAALLHDVAGSYDLAHLVLCAMDRQTGGDVAQRYLNRLLESGYAETESGSELKSVKQELPGKEVVDSQLSRASAKASTILETASGIAVSVPASLNCITTYVLLEQEQWFEREIGFLLRWLKQGMNAVDIGANVGVYSLPLARCVAPGGRVFAFEPGTGNREHLERGRDANGLDNLYISACALSDCEREAWLQIASSGEINAISEEGETSANAERVRVSSLDTLEHEWSGVAIDFVKIDAEGQEARIVAGGRDFFRRHSPLIMFEDCHDGSRNPALRWMFVALGFATYRLLGDASCLVPLASDERPDFFELNLFAAKSDRAARLEEAGLLVSERVEFALSELERRKAIRGLLDLPYARTFEFAVDDIDACAFREALMAYAAYRFAGLSAARRYAALCTAYEELHEFCAGRSCSAALACLVRVALDLGHRSVAVNALKQLLGMIGEPLDQPFFPPCQRYENVPAEGREAEWFSAAAIEQLEVSHELSSIFSIEGFSRLQSLCESPFVSPEMSRRTILRLFRSGGAGMRWQDVSKYLNPGHQHRNLSFWSSPRLSELKALI
ncbi:MAG: FkbM family methyltransferase [Rhodocyclales bacterium]|nr:FkbM family methyltransferase [Rhodocyclales bacterium]